MVCLDVHLLDRLDQLHKHTTRTTTIMSSDNPNSMIKGTAAFYATCERTGLTWAFGKVLGMKDNAFRFQLDLVDPVQGRIKTMVSPFAGTIEAMESKAVMSTADPDAQYRIAMGVQSWGAEMEDFADRFLPRIARQGIKFCVATQNQGQLPDVVRTWIAEYKAVDGGATTTEFIVNQMIQHRLAPVVILPVCPETKQPLHAQRRVVLRGNVFKRTLPTFNRPIQPPLFKDAQGVPLQYAQYPVVNVGTQRIGPTMDLGKGDVAANHMTISMGLAPDSTQLELQLTWWGAILWKRQTAASIPMAPPPPMPPLAGRTPSAPIDTTTAVPSPLMVVAPQQPRVDRKEDEDVVMTPVKDDVETTPDAMVVAGQTWSIDKAPPQYGYLAPGFAATALVDTLRDHKQLHHLHWSRNVGRFRVPSGGLWIRR